MAKISTEYCTNSPCNQKLRKYTYWVGKNSKTGKDGPFCKSCAEFIAHLQGENISCQVRVTKFYGMTEGSG